MKNTLKIKANIHRSIRRFLIFVFFAFVSTYGVFAQSEQSGNIEGNNSYPHNHYHNFYLGAKVGLIYIFGLEMEYIFKTRDISRFYLAAAAQSSLIISSGNAGGGVFLGKTGIGLGCRYHHLLWFESEDESKIQPGYGPEIIYNKSIGSKYIFNLHAGGIITEGYFFPDISFGVFLPLNK